MENKIFLKEHLELIPERIIRWHFESSLDIPTFDVSKNCFPEWILYYLDKEIFINHWRVSQHRREQTYQPSRLFQVEISLPTLYQQRELISQLRNLEQKYDALDRELDQQQTYLQFLRQGISAGSSTGKTNQTRPGRRISNQFYSNA